MTSAAQTVLDQFHALNLEDQAAAIAFLNQLVEAPLDEELVAELDRREQAVINGTAVLYLLAEVQTEMEVLLGHLKRQRERERLPS